MIDEKEAREILHAQGIHRCHGVKWSELLEETNRLNLSENPERKVILKDMISKLSGEAKLVVRVVLDAPEEMVQYLWGSEEKRITKITRHDLRQYLNWSCGWPFLMIEEVFTELREMVKKF